MRILITNDDGVLAPGIAALARAVADLGDVEVVAPETPQSAVGHAISVLSPLVVHRVHVADAFHAWSVDGRPADCVKLAMLELLDAPPDFVLSGINAGVNTGVNVLYSGTVAGAVEGAFFGIPSMAVSLELSEELDFEQAGRIARMVFRQYAASNPPPGMCLNVNIPALDDGPPRGVKVCAQCTVPMQDRYHRQTDPRGRSVYWLDGALPDRHCAPDTDHEAVSDRYVAITPLRFDLTDAKRLEQVRRWSWPTDFDARSQG
ncbi:MAG: 5'/3'-nucleotidase SurE [Planctomycetota bacterium]|nr:MAG: 5'/3'-nucleotidase SurE [Planctomycetota bacterium]